jgi:hypothetical protein
MGGGLCEIEKVFCFTVYMPYIGAYFSPVRLRLDRFHFFVRIPAAGA